jgi:hypothetical protein
MEAKLITRIRIQSPFLLSTLAEVMQESWDAQPRTFLRPFSPLIYFHRQVLDVLKELETKISRQDEHLIDTEAAIDQDGEHSAQSPFCTMKNGSDTSATTLAELRCYAEFISLEIMPLYTQFEDLDETSKAKVRFQDLWYLFRSGELVYRPCGTGADKDINNLALGNRNWRIYGIRPFWPKYRMGLVGHKNYMNEADEEMTSFGLHCYYLDYTGDEFCVVTETFEIQPYEGE